VIDLLWDFAPRLNQSRWLSMVNKHGWNKKTSVPYSKSAHKHDRKQSRKNYVPNKSCKWQPNFQPLWKMMEWKSVGMMIPKWMESHKIHILTISTIYDFPYILGIDHIISYYHILTIFGSKPPTRWTYHFSGCHGVISAASRTRLAIALDVLDHLARPKAADWLTVSHQNHESRI